MFSWYGTLPTSFSLSNGYTRPSIEVNLAANSWSNNSLDIFLFRSIKKESFSPSGNACSFSQLGDCTEYHLGSVCPNKYKSYIQLNPSGVVIKIAFPFLSIKVGDKYISQIFLGIFAASSIINKSTPSPTNESGFSQDIPSTVVPHLNLIYCSFSDARSISLAFPATISFHTSRNISLDFL